MQCGFEPEPFWLLHPHSSLPGLATSFPATEISKDLAKTACHQAVSETVAAFFPAEHMGEIC